MTQHVLTVRQTENKESECSITVHASLHAHARLRAINRPNLLNKQVICQSVNTEILKRPNSFSLSRKKRWHPRHGPTSYKKNYNESVEPDTQTVDQERK